MAQSDYKNTGGKGQFTPLAELHDAVDYLDRVLILGRANFPRIDSLQVGMAVLVNDEFMQVTAIGPGRVTVKRGCADTVPAKHPAKSLAWFIDVSVVGTDGVEYSAGDTTSIKYSPYTPGGALHPNNTGEIDVINFNWRFFRPYAPGRLYVNSKRWYERHLLSADTGRLYLEWTHRNRLIQSDKLLDHDDASVSPETGTTYTARIYNSAGQLRRTEVGILAQWRDRYGRLVYPAWGYSWQQGMADLGGSGLPGEDGALLPGTMTFHATRDGFDSWQGYVIPFDLDPQSFFLRVAQLGQIAAQEDDINQSSGPYPPEEAVLAASVGQISAQHARDEDYQDVIVADAMFVASVAEGTGQHTSFYTGMNRNLFEAPYAHLRRLEVPISGAHLVTVVARPGDRLTDSHTVWSRYDYPRGLGASFDYEQRMAPRFTPWLTVAKPVDYLDSVIEIATSSFYDGVPLDDVQPGQVALIDAEVVLVLSRTATTYTIARGVYDTVPAKHAAGARMWFFQAQAGNDPSIYPYTIDPKTSVAGAAAEVKMIPDVYGPPLDLNQVPTDRLEMLHRVERPYPPGEVLVNARAWYNGAQIAKDQVTTITWRHRNRDTQGANPVDHHAPTRAPEPGQKYRLKIEIMVRGSRPTDPSYPVTVRNEIVDGESFTYSYAMATTDGYRAATLLDVCGRVTVGLVLEAIRDDYVSWQNYVIPLLLPAPSCPPGKPPGGGQLPGDNGNGNGDTGGDPSNPTNPGGGDNTGGGEPGDNGGGDNGNGPPNPPEVPPDWPDPIEPPEPDPDDPNPALAGHWDTNWDRHWDAYTKDNQGE